MIQSSRWSTCFSTNGSPSSTTRSNRAPDFESSTVIGTRLDAPATSSSTDAATDGVASRQSRVRTRHHDGRHECRAATFPASPPTPTSRPTLALAHSLADAADAITMARFRADDLVVETKPDLTPVTEADRAVEAMIRDRLARDRPGDAVLGEEFGTTGDRRRGRVDRRSRSTAPRATPAGIPVWATLIALEVDGELDRRGGVGARARVAVVGRPRPRARTATASPVTVSKVARIEDAHLAYDSVDAFESVGLDDGVPRAGAPLLARARLRRLLGPHARGRRLDRHRGRGRRARGVGSRRRPIGGGRGGRRPLHRPAGRTRASTPAT